jgi:asparagine synthase (glutamine-hydrolysing)
MCGINGILRLNDSVGPVEPARLRAVRDYMAKRGPDATGEWFSADGRVGLGHRRLAIIDLSDAGIQPMSWDNGRYQIVFNGEIYNYRALRDGLVAHGVQLRSHSDTEVILALFAREGVAMLPRLRGMFTFALWDEQEQRLVLARDPYGIKPFYYTSSGGYFQFASQVRALAVDPAVSQEVNPAGLVGFLLWGSVPEPHTFLRDVKMLPAGHYLSAQNGQISEARPFHQFDQTYSGQPPDIAAVLEQTVAAHLVADVPVSVFLSSGLDSALIAALASRLQDTTTITMTFDSLVGTPSDEGPLAAEIAHKLGTNHIERHITRSDFGELWPRVLDAMDQPTIDGFNTYVISQVAHELGFKVVLSGLGGDELFGGYPSFRDIPRWQQFAQTAHHLPLIPVLWESLAPTARRPKLRGMLRYGHTVAGAFYLRRGLYLPDELPAIIGPELAEMGLAAYDPIQDAGRFLPDNSAHDVWYDVHLMESTQYMRNQLLRDSDWASMAHSLELRVPLVDAFLRQQMVAHNFEPARQGGKAAVVRQAAPELPDAIWDRPKTGFTIPVMEWLRPPGAETYTRGLDSRQLALKVLEAFNILPERGYVPVPHN